MTVNADLKTKIDRLLDQLPDAFDDLKQEVRTLCNDLGDRAEKFDLLKFAIDQIPNELYIKDVDSRFIIANTATEITTNMTRDGLVGKTDFDLFPAAEAQKYRNGELKVMTRRKASHYAPIGKTYPDGSPHWYKTSKYPMFNSGGDVIGICGVSQHVTQSVQTEFLLRSQAEVLEAMVMNRSAHDIFLQICTLIESQLPELICAITLLDDERLRFAEMIAPRVSEAYRKSMVGVEIGPDVGASGAACYLGEPVYITDISDNARCANHEIIVATNGRACWATPIIDRRQMVRGSLTLYSATARQPSEFEKRLMSLAVRLAEMTIERDRAVAKIQRMAERDSLTGLMNRSSFERHFDACLAQAGDRTLALAFVDFNDFKLINDKYGHSVGDAFLRTVGDRLAEAGATYGASVARLGGDEFVVVFDNIGAEAIQDVVTRLMRATTAPIRTADHTLTVQASVGIAIYPEHGRDGTTLLAHADAAMYHAKKHRHGGIAVYDPLFSEQRHRRRLLADELRQAIADGDIDLDYQPSFSLPDGVIVGVEALARWNHATRGRIPPAEFIPVAEEVGLIAALGEVVLHKACRQAESWRRQFGPVCKVAVNVSAHQFRDGEILGQVNRALAASGLPPRLLELELTESVLLEDAGRAVDVMATLRALGITIAIDDFGTGFSNFVALAQLPLDTLKIDRSIIHSVSSNASVAAITSSIIAMGQNLGMRVLAEGVETTDQLAFLIKHKCDRIQGYIAGRPSSPTAIRHMLEDRRGTSAAMPEHAMDRQAASDGRALKRS